jgi:hypothetical protein
MAGNPLEDYLRELRDIRRSGSAVPETSYYPALIALLDAVGATLKPKVRCVAHPSHGAGIPDIGLFTPDQFQKASAQEPLPGTKASRGVVEAKPTGDNRLAATPTLNSVSLGAIMSGERHTRRQAGTHPYLRSIM